MILTVVLGIGLVAMMTYIGMQLEAGYRACLTHYGLARPALKTVYLATVGPLFVAVLSMAYLLNLLVSSVPVAVRTANLAGAFSAVTALSAVTMFFTLGASWAFLQRKHLVLLHPAQWSLRGVFIGWSNLELALSKASSK